MSKAPDRQPRRRQRRRGGRPEHNGADNKRERAEEFKQHQQEIQAAFQGGGQPEDGWLGELIELEDLENRLNKHELDKIRGLVNKQWVLGKLSEAQEHDRWYKLEVMKIKVLGSFPPSESAIQGPLRAFLMDDPGENLQALTATERGAIDQIFTSLQNMLTRSGEGFERKQINTRYAGTESFETQDDDDSGFSLFG